MNDGNPPLIFTGPAKFIWKEREGIMYLNVSLYKKWLKDNGLPEMKITNEKDPGCMRIYDDRAIRVEFNTESAGRNGN